MTPHSCNKRYLTSYYINYLDYINVVQNMLFWITVWVTATVQCSSFERRGYLCCFSVRFGYRLGVGADNVAWCETLGFGYNIGSSFCDP